MPQRLICSIENVELTHGFKIKLADPNLFFSPLYKTPHETTKYKWHRLLIYSEDTLILYPFFFTHSSIHIQPQDAEKRGRNRKKRRTDSDNKTGFNIRGMERHYTRQERVQRFTVLHRLSERGGRCVCVKSGSIVKAGSICKKFGGKN